MAAVAPRVDVNMMTHNDAATVRAAVDSVLCQTWPNVSLTVIDNASTDGTADILRDYAASNPSIRIKHNRCDTGATANLQRAFWLGDADYIMAKTGDDRIALDYIERLMDVLLAHPACAMCHAAGLVFSETGEVEHRYPPEHCLAATGPDPVARARHVMQHYTSAPSFWGVYRRDAVEQLSTIRYRAGCDHAVLAELALYGEIRHVPDALYWRRGGGKPVAAIARSTNEQGSRGVPLDDLLAEQRWRTPLITTAHAHLEAFAAARLPLAQRLELTRSVAEIFRYRWLPLMRHEVAVLRAALPEMLRQIGDAEPLAALWLGRMLSDVLFAVRAMVPEEDVALALIEVAAVCGEAPQSAMRQFG
jgi:hypothetical protein